MASDLNNGPSQSGFIDPSFEVTEFASFETLSPENLLSYEYDPELFSVQSKSDLGISLENINPEILLPLADEPVNRARYDFTSKFKFPESADIIPLPSLLGALVLTSSGKTLKIEDSGTSIFIPEPGKPIPTEVWPDRERKAHRFRMQRMRMINGGHMRDGVLSHLPDRFRGNEAHRKGVSELVRRHEDLHRNTQSSNELHRALTPLVAGIMHEPEMRREFMSSLDSAALVDSEKLKDEARSKKDGLKADVVILGAGIGAAIFAAKLRAINPEIRIVAIDKANKIGGQMRKHGDRPAFYTNSRNTRPQDNGVLGLPGSTGNINSFGSKATVQVPDIASEAYATNLDLGDPAAINLHLNAETMLGVSFQGNKTARSGKSSRITVRDVDSDEELLLRAGIVVALTGPGERDEAEIDIPGVLTAEEVLSHFGDSTIPFPMDRFIDKEIAVKGGRDTGNIINELFAGLAPPAANGKSAVQFGGPRSIRWYGTRFVDRDDFCDQSRPRYERLASFISTGPSDTTSLITPDPRKVDATRPSTVDGTPIVIDEDGINRFFDIVIDATTLKGDIYGQISNKGIDGTSEITVPARELGLGVGEAVVARRVDGSNMYVAGTSAKLPLTSRERTSFADGIVENTISIWASVSKLEKTADIVSQELLQGRS